MRPAAVYLHGFASSPMSAKARFFHERFAERGIAIAIPDLAPEGFEKLSITSQLAVVDETAGGRDAVLLGSSMGGYVAALYAARHARVKAVILLAPAFDFARRWDLSLGPVKVRAWRETGWLEVHHYGTGTAARVSYQLYEDALQYEAWPRVPQPALVLHGTRDDVVPVALAEEFAARNPSAVLHTLDSDHQLTDVTSSLWEKSWNFLRSAGLF